MSRRARACSRAKIEGKIRPFHDGRQSAITNAAAAGVSPGALKARAGHVDLGTTQRYIDLAGVLFRGSLSRRLRDDLSLTNRPLFNR